MEFQDGFKGFPSSNVGKSKKAKLYNSAPYDPTRQKKNGPYSSGLPKNVNRSVPVASNVRGHKTAKRANRNGR